jgi:hypothetical protein
LNHGVKNSGAELAPSNNDCHPRKAAYQRLESMTAGA